MGAQGSDLQRVGAELQSQIRERLPNAPARSPRRCPSGTWLACVDQCANRIGLYRPTLRCTRPPLTGGRADRNSARRSKKQPPPYACDDDAGPQHQFRATSGEPCAGCVLAQEGRHQFAPNQFGSLLVCAFLKLFRRPYAGLVCASANREMAPMCGVRHECDACDRFPFTLNISRAASFPSPANASAGKRGAARGRP